MLWGRTLYVDVDERTLREAERWAEQELLAASAVVRHAQRDHSAFWRRVDMRAVRSGGATGASA